MWYYNQVPAVMVIVSPKTCSELQIMVTSTTAFLVAGRFGLAPTVKQQATSGLRLVDNGTKGLSTGDPAGKLVPFAASVAEDTERHYSSVLPCCVGFTAVDVLGHGTMAHVIGVGAILSLRVRSLQHPLLVQLLDWRSQHTSAHSKLTVQTCSAGTGQDLKCCTTRSTQTSMYSRLEQPPCFLEKINLNL